MDLSSWNLSVHNISSSSAFVEWTDFPLNVTITQFMVMFTEENSNLSALLEVQSLYDRGYFLYKLLKPHRTYKFQVLAFTGGVENVTYSTEIITITTGEGGKDCVATIQSEVSNFLCMNLLYKLNISPLTLQYFVLKEICSNCVSLLKVSIRPTGLL